MGATIKWFVDLPANHQSDHQADNIMRKPQLIPLASTFKLFRATKIRKSRRETIFSQKLKVPQHVHEKRPRIVLRTRRKPRFFFFSYNRRIFWRTKKHWFLRVPAKLARSGSKRQFLPPGVQVCPYYLATASRAQCLWAYQWSPIFVVLVVARSVIVMIPIFLCYLPPLVDCSYHCCVTERKSTSSPTHAPSHGSGVIPYGTSGAFSHACVPHQAHANDLVEVDNAVTCCHPHLLSYTHSLSWQWCDNLRHQWCLRSRMRPSSGAC